ncbi:FAD-dependent oxidoreductase, partial [Candidatus Latescibacterota bacterium]
FHKGGIEDLSGTIIIDATGDGDIAAWSGASIEIGRDYDSACQPMSALFRMANVDIERLPDSVEINRFYDRAKKTGEVTNPRHNVLKFYTVHPDVLHFNTTRVLGKSALDGWSITEAEIEGRRQVQDMVRFLKKYIHGFEESYLSKTGTQIGVRESRRIMGHYVLTSEDVLEARHFEDGIACGCYSIDIHNPDGEGTIIKRLQEGTYYQIPYRCLIPKKLDNCIIASRCISTTHEAHGSVRVMPTVWSIGQAGGTSAAMCIRKCIQPRDVDVKELRTTLKNQGAFIE